VRGAFDSGRRPIHSPLSLGPKKRHGSSLQTAMQRGLSEMRNAGLSCIKTVVQRQRPVPSKGNDRSLFCGAKNSRVSFLRTHCGILNTIPLTPFFNSFDLDAKLPAERRVRSRHESSYFLRGNGAAGKNLSYSPSF